MAVIQFDNPQVSVMSKVREYFKTDKYLGGLIKVTRSVRTETLAQEINIYLPKLSRDDQVFINGIEVVPKPSEPVTPKGKK